MKAQELIAILERRGLRVTVSNGMPVMVGDKSKATPALVEAMRVHRFEILQHLGLALATRGDNDEALRSSLAIFVELGNRQSEGAGNAFLS